MKKLIAITLISTIALTGCLDESAPVAVQPKIEEPKVSFGAWRDAMTGKLTHYVKLTSVNSAAFNWPYNKNTKAHLFIDETNVVQVVLDSGQVICSSYHGCNVDVKFDDKPIQSELARGSTNGQHHLLFFCKSSYNNCNSKHLINKIKSSKTMKVKIEVYQHGYPVFEFDTSEYMDHPALIKVKS